MRNADGIARALTARQERLEAERRRNLVGLLRELRFARECGAEWYRWVVDGMPRLTPAEYEAIKAKRRTRRTSK
jgi:hypothetical protein